MSAEHQEPATPQLSDGFSKARGSALIASGLLFLANLGKVDLTKPISFLGVSIPEPNIVKGVLCVLAAYNIFRMTIEWFQSNPARRNSVVSKIDYATSLLFSLAAVCWYLFQPINFESLSKIPFLPTAVIIGYGFFFGQMSELWISSLQFLRSQEDALRLGLHRRPYAIRCVHKSIPYTLIPIGLFIALSPSFSQPLANIWLFLLFGSFAIGFLGGLIDFIRPSRRRPDGRVIKRKEYVASMQRIFEWHDALYQMRGWDKRAPNKHTPLYESCEQGDVEKVKQLLKPGVPVNLPELHRWTPLMIAVAQQHREIVELLLEKGANPNTANCHGRTPLSFAARYGRKDIVQQLLKYGANPNFKEGSIFEPPLEIAAECGHKQIVEILLKAGADPSSKGHMKITPLDAAEFRGHGGIAAILRNAISKK